MLILILNFLANKTKAVSFKLSSRDRSFPKLDSKILPFLN